MTQLVLADGTTFEGEAFGADREIDGEVVFNTGMAGYPESLTDPSYRGQILVFTYPLIGNYGVPSEELNEHGFSANFESEAIHVRGVVVANLSKDYSHHKAVSSLHNWMEHHKIPGITGVDTRALTKKLRETGVMLGRMTNGKWKMENGKLDIDDPNELNLVAEVSCTEVHRYEPTTQQLNNSTTVIAYDCGMKRNIIRSFLKRGVTVVRVPWDFDLDSYDGELDAVFISNGPGNPKMCQATINNIQKAMSKDIPTFGICLGNQLLALAVGGDTFKMKYGHRGVNQPCLEQSGSSARGEKNDDHKCIITSQNHGFAVDPDSLPKDWKVWFTNANDKTVEGIRHNSGKFFSVQFHPEATPGPEDASYLFDEFVGMIASSKKKGACTMSH